MAKLRIGGLTISVSAKTAKMEKGLDRASGAVRRFSKRSVRAMMGVTKSMLSFKSAIAVAVGGAGLGVLMSKSLQAIDKVGKMSKIFKISTEDIGAMSLAARLGGTSIETMLKATRNISKVVVDFGNGVGLGKEALESLGVSMSDLQPLMNDQAGLLAFLVGKVNGVSDATERMSIAQDLLGGRATEVMAALGGGVDQLNAYRVEAELLGISMSGAMVAGVEDANDSVERLTSLMGGFVNQTTAALAPALGMAAESTTDWLLSLAKTEGGVKGLAFTLADSILRGVLSAISGLQRFSGAIGDVITVLEDMGIVEKEVDENSAERIKQRIAGLKMVIFNQRNSIRVTEGMQLAINALAEEEGNLARVQALGGDAKIGFLASAKSGVESLIRGMRALKEAELDDTAVAVTSTGGGGAVDLAALEAANADRLNIMRVNEFEQARIHKEGLDLITQQTIESNEALALLDEEKSRRAVQAISDEREAKFRAMVGGVGDATTIFSRMAALTKTANGKQTASSKIFARASIITSTAVAVMNALQVQPFPVGVALAATAAAMGAKQLSTVGGGGGISQVGGGGGVGSRGDSGIGVANNQFADARVGGNNITINFTGAVIGSEKDLSEAIGKVVKDSIESEDLVLTVSGEQVAAG